MREQRTKVKLSDQQEFEKWWIEHSGDYPNTVGGGEKRRDAVWQYFQREFPREALENALRIELGFSDIDHFKIISIVCAIFERLWNGGEKGAKTDGTTQLPKVMASLERSIIENADVWSEMAGTTPVCKTCGGSGRRCPYGECQHPAQIMAGCELCPEYILPCPDCTEQYTFLRSDDLKYPDQRRGQRRKGVECRRLIMYGRRKIADDGAEIHDRREGNRRGDRRGS